MTKGNEQAREGKIRVELYEKSAKHVINIMVVVITRSSLGWYSELFMFSGVI